MNIIFLNFPPARKFINYYFPRLDNICGINLRAIIMRAPKATRAGFMGHQVASHFGRRKSRAGKNCVIKCREGGGGETRKSSRRRVHFAYLQNFFFSYYSPKLPQSSGAWIYIHFAFATNRRRSGRWKWLINSYYAFRIESRWRRTRSLNIRFCKSGDNHPPIKSNIGFDLIPLTPTLTHIPLNCSAN